MKAFIASILLTVGLLSNCNDGNNPSEPEYFDNLLHIQTDKNEYYIDSISSSRYVVITGTLTNTSSQTLYSELGDWMNSSIEHDLLLFSRYNDGRLEYYNSENEWMQTEQSALIEGSRVVQLAPKKSYKFNASAHIGVGQTGKYRLTVKYYKNYNEAVTDTLKDRSNIFSILDR